MRKNTIEGLSVLLMSDLYIYISHTNDDPFVKAFKFFLLTEHSSYLSGASYWKIIIMAVPCC